MTDSELAARALEAYTATPDLSGQGPFRGTHAIIRTADDEGATVVAFRGTDDPGDWLFDMMAAPALGYFKEGLGSLCFMHRGFLITALSIYGRLRAQVGTFGEPVILTGHSLGGAIALIIGAMLKADGTAPKQIVTFGAPRVGFGRFASVLEDIPVRQYRRGNDPVPSLPAALPLFPYRQARLPLIQVGTDDIHNPFACHHMAGYAEDVTAYLKEHPNG